MNLFACLLFVPILLFAHMAGWEDVSEAFAMTFRFQEVSMLIAWLALQMALISVITVGVILMTDSFWAVALRALRVVYWWVQQLSAQTERQRMRPLSRQMPRLRSRRAMPSSQP